jgi:hypothetical protein
MNVDSLRLSREEAIKTVFIWAPRKRQDVAEWNMKKTSFSLEIYEL